MLQRYARENGFVVYNEYIDDGFSGTNFERPDFKRMLSDIEEGKIGGVLCKDLSRLGRNNALVAYYTEIYFIDNDVRFIAVNDCIDSAKGDNEIMPFKSVINEYYARDISKKVRSAKRTQALEGKHSCWRAPYGYKKNPADRHKLLIDEETAPVVKRMYQMSASGMGNYQIAKKLFEDKVLTPAAYEHKQSGRLSMSFDKHHPFEWVEVTVASILTNETYIGSMVSHRQATKSFKNSKKTQIPKEDWIIFKNHHEPIVDQDLFDKVQKVQKIKKRRNKLNTNNIFVGLLFCSDCNHRMSYASNASRASRERPMYSCSYYRRGFRKNDNKQCTSHYIKAENLNKIVLESINSVINANLNEDTLIKLLKGNKVDNTSAKKKALEKLKQRNRELSTLTKKAFEQNALDIITNTTFAELYSAYQAEQKEVTEKIVVIEEELSTTNKQDDGFKKFAELISKYKNITELTREVILDLIEKVVVHEAVKEKGKKRTQEIEIHYRFIGQLPD
jgi:DNA invertase Pin-like site-specific DNA recombinase